MSILLDEKTPVLVHGLPDEAAMFYTNAMLDYGTDVVAGVCHQHAGTRVLGRPVFPTVEDAVRETQATAAVIFRNSATVTDAILESADAGLQLIVAITLRGRVPVRDKLSVNRFLERWPPEHRPLLLGQVTYSAGRGSGTNHRWGRRSRRTSRACLPVCS